MLKSNKDFPSSLLASLANKASEALKALFPTFLISEIKSKCLLITLNRLNGKVLKLIFNDNDLHC